MLNPDTAYEWTIPATTTGFQVSIDGSVYRMKDILGVEACGNSLPLGIYRDRDDLTQVSATMYNSMILPTIVADIPEISSNGIHTFGFRCFGTDSQAIQITYYDPSLAYDGKTFTVRFNPSGASGQMSDQQMEVDVDVVEPRNLRKCGFYWPGSVQRVFLGWAFYPQAESDPRIDLQDGQRFDWTEYRDQIGSEVESGVLDLYAVWYTTELGNNPTELILEV